MLARLPNQIDDCREQARMARIRSMMATSVELQKGYQRMEQHWLQLAETLEFALKISGYLQWTSQRLEPPT